MQNTIENFRLALSMQKYAEAEQIVRKELAHNPNSAMWHNEMGTFLLGQGNFNEALQYFDQAISIEAGFVEAILNSIIILSDLGFYHEAAKRYESLIQIEKNRFIQAGFSASDLPQNAADCYNYIAETHKKLALMHRQLKQDDLALMALEKSIASFDNVEARIELVKIFIEKKEFDRALAELELARRLEPKRSELQVIAAQIHLLSNKQEEAQEALARSALLDDKSHTGNVLRAAYQTELLQN